MGTGPQPPFRQAPKAFKLFDGGGLFLLVTPVGGKLWHFKYRFAGKEKKLAFGAYPIITLAEARQRREEAKRLLAGDVDPAEVRKARKEELETEQRTFERVALDTAEWNIPAVRMKTKQPHLVPLSRQAVDFPFRI